MSGEVTLSLNGEPLTVPRGCTVAAALLRADNAAFRRSVTGEARGPLCGMGICFECRVTVNGYAHAKSCQIICREGMEVKTV